MRYWATHKLDHYVDVYFEYDEIYYNEESIFTSPGKDIIKKPGASNFILGTEIKRGALISNFDWLEPSEASKLLTSMGLASIPSWLRPFHLLSNGEQYRAQLAYLVASAKDGETILIDEYTSVVDRDVAKAMSNAVQKYIRRTNTYN